MLKPHYQKFAELVAKGTDPVEAYKEATGTESMDAAYKGSERLSKNVEILAEIERLQRAAEMLAGSAVMELKEAMEMLSAMVRDERLRLVRRHEKPAPVDPDQPLLLEVEPEPAAELTYEKRKDSDKLKALELLGRLRRWFAEDRRDDAEADGLDELLDRIHS